MAACGYNPTTVDTYGPTTGDSYGPTTGDSYGPTTGASYGPATGGDDCEDCVQVVKTTKKVRVPCHRNQYKQYTVKVPRKVCETVPRQVTWTDYETRSKQVPYTDYRMEQRIKYKEEKYQVPTCHTVTKFVNITKKMPKTIYVDVTSCVPKQETITKMETRSRQVKIPYTVTIPETKYKTQQYQFPVKKSKTVFDKHDKIVYDTQIRTRCEPKVTFVTKEIPVYNVVARPPQPCPPQQEESGYGQVSSGSGDKYGTAATGYGTTADAGYGTTAATGYGTTAAAGYGTTATTGYGATADAGYGTTAATGYGTTADAGYGTTATTGYGATADAGYGTTATTGYDPKVETPAYEPATTGYPTTTTSPPIRMSSPAVGATYPATVNNTSYPQ